MKDRKPQGGLLDAVKGLLDATEALHDAVVAAVDPKSLDSALLRRDIAFELLRECADQETILPPAARACLDRVKALDEEMLEHGIAVVGQLRGERRSVQRRRSAIQAHAKRERGEPRLLTVKA